MPRISQYPALFTSERNQKRNVANLSRRAPLEDDPIATEIRMLALDGPPSLERPVNLLVQLRHGRRRHPCAPQSFRDILHPPYRDPAYIHLDQRLFDRALPSSIALDGGRLERLLA
jgi:hypothetical protein